MPEEQVQVIEETKSKKTRKPKKEKVEKPEGFPSCLCCFIYEKLCKELKKITFPISDHEIKKYLIKELSALEFVDSRGSEQSDFTTFYAQRLLKAAPREFLELQINRLLKAKNAVSAIPPLIESECSHQHYLDVLSKQKDSLQSEYESFDLEEWEDSEELSGDCNID